MSVKMSSGKPFEEWSNVDLLNAYDDSVYNDRQDTLMQQEILRRMDAGIKARNNVAAEPSEHAR